MQRNTKKLNIITGFCMSCYSIPVLLITFRPCTHETNSHYDSIADTVSSTIFAILGLVFFVCGLIMNLSLKSQFPHFYDSFHWFLWVACFSLSAPLLLRSVTNVLYSNSTTFNNWYTDQFVFANTTFLIVTTYIPILTSAFSLVFGYLRKRQESMVKDENDKDAYMALGMHGGSGELAPPGTDATSSYDGSALTSEVQSYLDPPIENYRSIYGRRSKSPTTSTGGSGNLSPHSSGHQFKAKRFDKKKRRDGVGGTDSFQYHAEIEQGNGLLSEALRLNMKRSHASLANQEVFRKSDD